MSVDPCPVTGVCCQRHCRCGGFIGIATTLVPTAPVCRPLSPTKLLAASADMLAMIAPVVSTQVSEVLAGGVGWHAGTGSAHSIDPCLLCHRYLLSAPLPLGRVPLAPPAMS